jgi:uncharacterized protein DUF4105
MRALVRAFFALVAILFVAWGGLALFYAGPRDSADVLAAAWTVVALAILLLVRPFGRCVVAFAAAAAVLLFWWSTLHPSNDRHWISDVARLPRAELDGDRLTIQNVRNFDYRSETDYTERWETRTYDLSNLDHLDLFMSYWGSPKIAHTIMSWAFRDGHHLAVSIETRKEVGESYDAIAGFFRQYELYYVVADERDVIRLRTNYRGEHVYLYPLRTRRERVRLALIDYARSINSLAEKPQFYNAGTDNCTTTIRMHAQHIGAKAPWDYRMNGYMDEMLYERGTIDTSRPFAKVRATSLIDARARAADHDPAFSRAAAARRGGAVAGC